MRTTLASSRPPRREDVDFSSRTTLAINALLKALEDPTADRVDVRRRVVDYAQSFEPEFVDFEHLNRRLVDAGLEPIPDAREPRARTPLAQLAPEQRDALARSRRFYAVDLPRSALPPHIRAPTEAVVRAVCGDMMTALEYSTALEMLNNAYRLDRS